MKGKSRESIFDGEFYLFKFNLLGVGQWPTQPKYVTILLNGFIIMVNIVLICGQVDKKNTFFFKY